MKNVIYTCLLTAGMLFFSFIGTANAVIEPVNFDEGSFVNMGELDYGQYGTIKPSKAFGRVAISEISALLPSHSAVTFSYNFKGDLIGGLLAAGGQYTYVDGGDLHQGFTVALSNTSLNFASSTVNGVQLDTALAYSSADLDIGGNTASATIISESGGLLDITSTLFAFVGGSKKYTISYNVTEAPIPAALPMFAMGLCAVAGIRRRKKAAA